jgi:hypothetical protein
VKLARGLAVALGLWFLALLAYVFFRRVGYPYDLEWMEGGILCHALRLSRGEPGYAAPSVDFVPFLYTALYPALLAGLGKLFGLSHALGRVVSLLATVGTMALGWAFVRKEGGSRAAALTATGLFAAAYVPTAAWYDLARPDSLFLFLVTAALLLGWWRRDSLAGGAMAALLMVAAFFTKQTASPFMIALGLALLLMRWRVALAYGAVLALVGLPLLYLSNRMTGGWFWTYVFRLHQQHDFYPGRAFLGSPLRLLLLLGPGLLLVPWALVRRRSPGLIYATWMGVAGAGAACVGFGTQWAFMNAFIPGVLFPALAIGVAAGRLVAGEGLEAPPRLRPPVVWLLVAGSLVCAPGGLIPLFSRVTPREWAIDRDAPTGYDPRPYLPTAEDRRRGDALLARLRAVEGEVLVPFHPFYAHQAGKRTYLHRMGVLDVTRAGLGTPRGLAEAIAEQKFAVVVMDNKIDGNWHMWPGLLARYRITEQLEGPRVPSGAQTFPRYWLTPVVVDREP